MSGFAVRDGRTLHVESTGTGEPRVLLEAGLGGTRTQWALVAPALAAVTTVLAYDRAGLGRSDPAPGPRDHARMACDLDDLIGRTPVVLVGHSLGGAVAELYARTRPDRVAGLVLVDPSAPQQDVPLPGGPAFRLLKVLQPVSDALEAASDLVRLALARPSPAVRDVAASMPPDLRAQTLREAATRSAARAVRAEGAAQQRSLTALFELRRTTPLPDIPVTVLTAGERPKQFAELWDNLAASHRRLAASVPRGRHVVAARAGHLIPQERPDLVIEEILRVVREVRGAA
ncbi:alpha/beta fold hydrolase [Nonomuraea sp. NPDC050328]|uniref:alpha/beta fold hydrolase n=1 Tax=Nonomuraea sp. NPDC050328 TaxID=3364361 RepID=UPI0037A730AA